ncbi:MAG: OsmC family protein [Natronospirillum sp.]
MSVHQSVIRWHRSTHKTEANTYSRNHRVLLNGDQQVDVSASVDFKGDPSCADPEQMLVSAVSSCHMLFFLAIAEFQGYEIASYEDNPVGYLERGDSKGMAVTRIVLSPQIHFVGDAVPDRSAVAKLHASAHKNCFIRNSVTAEVTIDHP